MKVVIVGAGAVGTHLSKLLSGEHQDCVLIDADSERLAGMNICHLTCISFSRT